MERLVNVGNILNLLLVHGIDTHSLFSFLVSILFYLVACSPVFLFYWVVAKLLCTKKISNKLFWIIAIPLIIITVLMLYDKIEQSSIDIYRNYPKTTHQYINTYLASFCSWLTPFCLLTTVLLPTILIFGTVFSIKNKDKKLLIKTSVCSLILGVMLYFSSPAFYHINIILKGNRLEIAEYVELYSEAAKHTKFIPHKTFYMIWTANWMMRPFPPFFELSENDKVKYLETLYETSDFLGEHYRYVEYELALVGAIDFNDYENIRKYIKIIESIDDKVHRNVVEGYVKLKEYNKALELVNKLDSYPATYALKTKIYLFMNDRENAEKNFKEYQKTSRYFRNKTLEDFEKRHCK